MTACDDIHGDTARPPPSLLLNGQGGPPTLPLFPLPLSISLLSLLILPFCLSAGRGDGDRDACRPAVPSPSPSPRQALVSLPPPPSGRRQAAPLPGIGGAWAAAQCPPPKNVWKLPLGRCQELCTDWHVGQGRCSCRQVLENSTRPMASRCWLSRAPPSQVLSPARPSGTPAALGEGSLAYGET